MKKSFTKVALLGALGVGSTALGLMHETNANADVKINDHQIQIEQGDTLYEVAQHNGTDVNTLTQINHLENPNLIIAGSVLNLDDNNASQSQSSTSAQAIQAPQGQANTQSVPSAQPIQQQAPAQQAAPSTTQSTNYASQVTGSEAAAKAWIAAHESGGNYNATNGQYIGKYQLSASYLNGDYSPANQEQAADNYVHQRYGSWGAAQSFWQSHGWY